MTVLASSAADGHRGAAVALVVLLAALAVAVLVSTPWTSQPAPPGGRTAADPARDFTAAERAREDAYHRAVRPPQYASMLAGLAVAAALGLTAAGARLVEAVARPLGGGWLWQVVLGAVALALVGQLAAMPFAARVEVVNRRYGLSTRDWTGWLVDAAKSYGVGVAITTVTLVGFYAITRAAPRSWWAWTALAGAALVVLLSFAYPVLVEPVFNRFRSMPDGPLRTSLLELARADGVPVSDVLVADASRRTTRLNAYVSGFGATRRIVVYDTLLDRAPPEQVRLVVAHELGHAKHRDVLHGTAIGALGIAAGACAAYLVLGWAPLLRRAGVTGAADPRSLALLALLAALAGLLTSPAQALVSRRIEARADVHALDLAADPAIFASMQRELAVSNLSDLDPHPLVYAMFATHPTAPQRIALARDWARREGTPVPQGLSR
jgi:STE24 endopeptidase